jgi:hypothetical protein
MLAAVKVSAPAACVHPTVGSFVDDVSPAVSEVSTPASSRKNHPVDFGYSFHLPVVGVAGVDASSEKSLTAMTTPRLDKIHHCLQEFLSSQNDSQQ